MLADALAKNCLTFSRNLGSPIASSLPTLTIEVLAAKALEFITIKRISLTIKKLTE